VDRHLEAGLAQHCGAVAGPGSEDQWSGRHGRSLADRYPDPMPAPLPDPAGTTVVTMELQRGVVGDVATLPDLVDVVAARGTLDRCGELVAAARAAQVPVVHACVEWSADRRGTPL